MESFQHTLKKSVTFRGAGLHTGNVVTLTVNPAEPNSGILFRRVDLKQQQPTPAFMDRVVDTTLATTLGTEEEARISTTEHLLSALYGLGIDNALVELDGPEVPIMDGSAYPFVQVLRRAGRRRQQAHRWMIKFERPVEYRDGERTLRIEPYDGFKVTCEIDFPHQVIGRQKVTTEISPRRFVQEIASARTFGFLHEVEMLQKNGLARGGSLANAVVVDDAGVINPEGLRFRDEFVRHKILDIIGDLALLGFPMMGHVIARRSGHTQHLALMREVAACPDAWGIVAYEKQGDGRVLKRLATQTRKVGDKLIPYLLPPSLVFAVEPAPA